MPPLRARGFTEMMADAARSLGWHPFPGPAAINTRSYQNRTGCAYHGYCNRGGCHVNAKGSTAVTTIPKAQETGRLTVVTEAHVTTIESDGNGRVTGVNYLKDGTEYFQPARRRAARRLRVRERPDAAAVEVEGVSERAVEQPRPGGQALLQPQSGRRRQRALSATPEQLVRPAGAGRRGRQLGGRQLRSRRAGLHRRRQPVGLLGPPADRRGEHEHLRSRAAMGVGLEGVHPRERRSLQHVLSAEDDAAVRGQLSRSRSGREGSARVSGVPDHGRLQGERAEGRCLHPGQDGAVVPGGRRGGGRAGRHRDDGADDARVRRHTDGRQPRDERGRPMGLFARSRRISACSARR